MKYVLGILIFFLPLHAFIVTTLKCKFGIDTNIIRFWKELLLSILVLVVFFTVYKKSNWSLEKLYHKNTLLGLITAFIICSAIYIFFPFFNIKPASVLGFRYDVYFLIAMLIGLYAGIAGEIRFFLKILFASTFSILIVFLPWYIFGDISTLAGLFWYSSEVSTYTANSCISFAQNVNGQHRFQWTFGWPIRFSVFLTVVWSLFTGFVLSQEKITQKQKYIALGLGGLLIIPAIFFSYSKTSILWALFAASMFCFLVYKYVYRKKITKKFYLSLVAFFTTPIVLVALLKWELFLHLGAVINRLDNLWKSVEMFFYNPIWYGLGIAGPASQIGNSIESAGSWQIATSTTQTVHTFLPENWYVQILLEQGIVGFALFMSLVLLIWFRLINLVKRSRSYINIWIATGYFALCFMALFTHAFEEAATSYILFLLIGIVLAESIAREQSGKVKKKRKKRT